MKHEVPQDKIGETRCYSAKMYYILPKDGSFEPQLKAKGVSMAREKDPVKRKAFYEDLDKILTGEKTHA